MAYASITYTSASGTTFALTNSSGDPIEYLRQADIKVFLNGTLQAVTTDYTFNTAGTAIVLNTSVSGATVIIQRITDVDAPAVDFTPGSTLVASDLNNATDQTLFGLQELRDEISFGGGVSDGDKGEIVVASSGTLWSIDTGAVTAAKIGTGAVTETKLGTGAVTETKLGTGAVTETKLGTGAVTAVKIAAAAFTDSVSSTSTTTIATPNSVKTAYDLANTAATPAGAVNYFAMSSAPTGYLKANGASVSRTTYAALFAAISTTFGVGDGSTTFNVPDLRGEFLRSWDDSRGVDSGRAFGSFQDQAYLSHSHSISDPGHFHSVHSKYASSVPVGGTGVLSDNNGGSFLGTPSSGSSATNISIQNSGGAETRPRNVALLACIKY